MDAWNTTFLVGYVSFREGSYQRFHGNFRVSPDTISPWNKALLRWWESHHCPLMVPGCGWGFLGGLHWGTLEFPWWIPRNHDKFPWIAMNFPLPRIPMIINFTAPNWCLSSIIVVFFLPTHLLSIHLFVQAPILPFTQSNLNMNHQRRLLSPRLTKQVAEKMKHVWFFSLSISSEGSPWKLGSQHLGKFRVPIKL